MFGGDGTFLRAAEFARPARVPMLGVNFGRVGFLAGAEPDALVEALTAVVDRRLRPRGADDAGRPSGALRSHARDGVGAQRASVEKSARERMLELAVAVDGHDVLRFGCDGVLCATPTGSTAYAYSAGGPILWPSLDALVVVPNAAHALFSRPIVVTPESRIDVRCPSRLSRSSELRRPPRDRLAARQPGHGSPRSRTDPDRAARGLELRRPSGNQVPAASVRFPQRPVELGPDE